MLEHNANTHPRRSPLNLRRFPKLNPGQEPRQARQISGFSGWLPLVLTLALLPSCAPQLLAGKSRTVLAVEPLQRLLALMRQGDIDGLNAFPVSDSSAVTSKGTGPIRIYDPFETRTLKDLLARYPKLTESLAQIAIDPDPPFVEEGRTYDTGQVFNGEPVLWYSGLVIFKFALPDMPAEKISVFYSIDGQQVRYASPGGISGNLRGMLFSYQRYIESFPTRAKSPTSTSPAPQGSSTPSGVTPAQTSPSAPPTPLSTPSTPQTPNPAAQPTLPASTAPPAWWPAVNAGQTWDVVVGRYSWRVTLTQRVDQAGASSIIGSATGTNGGAPGAIAAFAIVPSTGAVLLALQNDTFSIRCEFQAAQSSGSKLNGTATLRTARSMVDEPFGPCSAALAAR